MRRLALLLALLAPGLRAQEAPSVWPECRDGQIQVLLLGTYHMANPNLDAENVDADDVRAPERQAQLDRLVARLAAFEPQRVMVEWDYADRARADSLYATYLESGGATDSRSEVVQVGFRLARHLGHDAVYAVDYEHPMGSDSLAAHRQRGGRTIHTMDYRELVPERYLVDQDRLLRELTLVAYHRWLNDDTALRGNHFGMFSHLGAGAGDNYGGPDMLANWYSRNLNIAHNILRSVRPGDERVLVLVGAGHVRALRHVLDEAPHFCPVGPLPYLQ